MPITYGKRTGVTTLLVLIKHMCRLFLVFENKIVAWIAASALSTDNKSICYVWIATTKTVCSLLTSIPDD